MDIIRTAIIGLAVGFLGAHFISAMQKRSGKEKKTPKHGLFWQMPCLYFVLFSVNLLVAMAQPLSHDAAEIQRQTRNCAVILVAWGAIKCVMFFIDKHNGFRSRLFEETAETEDFFRMKRQRIYGGGLFIIVGTLLIALGEYIYPLLFG
ncbi:MAG: hypothetical protein LBN02_05455 [Oscillospiraceae bacterium]|nr:hypothetical protein [Oscillospiraceae bacterium]